jgi:hypothetical protein
MKYDRQVMPMTPFLIPHFKNSKMAGVRSSEVVAIPSPLSLAQQLG